MERILLALILLGPAAALADPPPCAPHDKVAAALASQYGEAARAMGLSENDAVMELYASTDSGTWTLAMTLPNGVTCLVASGRNFETVAPTQVKGTPA